MPEPLGRDLERTRSQIRGWLRGKLPGAEDLQLSELTAPEGSGFSNDTLLFDLTWSEGDASRGQSFVVRIHPSGFPIFPFYDVGKQYRVMKIIGENSDVPMPRMYWNEQDPGIIGAPFFVMERMEGRVPPDSPLYHVGGFLTELSEAERAAIWLNGIEVMTRIHKLDPQKLKAARRGIQRWRSLRREPTDERPRESRTLLRSRIQNGLAPRTAPFAARSVRDPLPVAC